VQPISNIPGGCLLSVGIFDHRSAELNSLPALGPLADGLNVMATAPTWVDVVSAAADKGSAVRRLQSDRGITPDQTAAFGDFLNDLTLLDAATYSFAMANAHPEVFGRAAWRAPANTESGVMTAVAALLGLPAAP
jgi:hydroxymethylpyrimidine pyrophosphatase-like HAD family hydrolase